VAHGDDADEEHLMAFLERLVLAILCRLLGLTPPDRWTY
jgi:hypothetical protein